MEQRGRGRVLIRRLIVVLLACVTVLMSGAATAVGQPPGGTPPLDLARTFSELPSEIAADVSTLSFGSATLTADDVDRTSRDLCRAQFDPQVAISMFEKGVPLRSTLLIGPATRLLGHASWVAVCSRTPTAAEERRYTKDLYAFLDNRPAPLPGPSALTPTESQMCLILESDATPKITDLLGKLVEFASREKIKVPQVVSLAVEAAGKGCRPLLPLARNALAEYTR